MAGKGAVVIWYVIYCPNQKEEEVIASCRRHLTADALRDAFVLTYDRMRRYEGVWHVERQPLFPDYVFLESGNPELFAREIKKYETVFHVLGDDEGPSPLEPEEERFLRKLCGPYHHSGMSRGYILDGKTHVTEGPLLGKEELICRIDRHKRLARLAMPGGEAKAFHLENSWKGRPSRESTEAAALNRRKNRFLSGRFREMNVGLEIVAKS